LKRFCSVKQILTELAAFILNFVDATPQLCSVNSIPQQAPFVGTCLPRQSRGVSSLMPSFAGSAKLDQVDGA